MTTPVTLGDLIHADKLLWVYCTACGHERDVNPTNVPLPGEAPVPKDEARRAARGRSTRGAELCMMKLLMG